jgi:hypothetical protein
LLNEIFEFGYLLKTQMGTTLLRIAPISPGQPKFSRAPGYGYCGRLRNSSLQMNFVALYSKALLFMAKPLSSPFGFPDAFPDKVSFSAFGNFPKKFVVGNRHFAV